MITTRAATRGDAHAIAELALIAGEGIPAFFWAQSQQPGETIIDVGARKVLSENENFSYRNVQMALLDNNIAGMMLAYRLPSANVAEALSDYPEFIRPLIELEQCVPDSYYINMIATFPKYRGRGVGTALLGIVDGLARNAGCKLCSIEVFEENSGAVRLYQNLGFRIIDRRPVVEHSSHPYSGYIALLARAVSAG